MRNLIIMLCMVPIALSACGSADSAATAVTTPAFVGKWVYSSGKLNGTDLSSSGFTSTADLSASSATITDKTSSCTATVSGIAIASDGRSTFNMGGGTVTCAPNPCDLSYTLGGAPVHVSCPSAFPVTISGGAYSVSGNVLTITYSVNGNTISEIWIRQ